MEKTGPFDLVCKKQNPQKPYSGSTFAEMKVFFENIYLTKISTLKRTSDKVQGPLPYFYLYQALSSGFKEQYCNQ